MYNHTLSMRAVKTPPRLRGCADSFEPQPRADAMMELVLLQTATCANEPRHDISNNVVCATSKVRSACAYAQSDQSLY